jgi:hypothetical protein
MHFICGAGNVSELSASGDRLKPAHDGFEKTMRHGILKRVDSN